MSTAVWTVFAVGAMIGMFAACVVAVVAGVRVLEGLVEKRRRGPGA
jgi:putative Ca2+/H+ antiporter (TMEM165/GDT1 family)